MVGRWVRRLGCKVGAWDNTLEPPTPQNRGGDFCQIIPSHLSLPNRLQSTNGNISTHISPISNNYITCHWMVGVNIFTLLASLWGGKPKQSQPSQGNWLHAWTVPCPSLHQHPLQSPNIDILSPFSIWVNKCLPSDWDDNKLLTFDMFFWSLSTHSCEAHWYWWMTKITHFLRRQGSI